MVHPYLSGYVVKKVEQSGKDWDKQLPYVLFAYRIISQESTKASPFFLVYGCNPKLPTTAALNPPVDRVTVSLADYQTEVAIRMSNAWESAKTVIKRAQKQQKTQHDKQAKDHKVYLLEIVCLYTFQQRNLGEITNSQSLSKVLML